MASTLPFAFGNRRGDPWNFVGLASSFSNLDLDGKSVSERRSCNPKGTAPGCKVYRIPRANNTPGATEASEVDAGVPDMTTLKDQVLVFRYKGKFHAVDNVSLNTCNSDYLGTQTNGQPALSAFLVPFIERLPL